MYGTTFDFTTLNLMASSQISYVIAGGIVTPLTIISFEWGEYNRCIIFYTNNPFDLTYYDQSRMKLFSMRLLQSSLTNI